MSYPYWKRPICPAICQAVPLYGSSSGLTCQNLIEFLLVYEHLFACHSYDKHFHTRLPVKFHVFVVTNFLTFVLTVTSVVVMMGPETSIGSVSVFLFHPRDGVT